MPLATDARYAVGRIVTAICLAAIALWVLYSARQAVLTIYVSVVLAIGLSPLVRIIERQRLRPLAARVPRWAAILSIYVLIVGVLVGSGFVFLPALTRQARALVNQLPALIERGRAFLLAQGIQPPDLSVNSLLQQMPSAPDVAGTIAYTTFELLGGAFGIIAILGLSFYLLIESADLFAAMLRVFPREQRPTIRLAAGQIAAKVSSWLAMQAMLAILIGTTTAIVLSLLGIPYPYVLALAAAIGELVPIIGPLLAAVPGIIIAATVSWQLALAVGVFYLLQQQLENHVLVPKLMGDRVGLSAVAVIVALLIGGSLLGVLGVILAIPTAAIVQVVLQHAVADR